jgi:hypothetical protein
MSNFLSLKALNLSRNSADFTLFFGLFFFGFLFGFLFFRFFFGFLGRMRGMRV